MLISLGLVVDVWVMSCFIGEDVSGVTDDEEKVVFEVFSSGD